MARKTAVPSDQLDRLRDLYNQERSALVALANAEQIVGDREEDVRVAQRVLKEAQAGAGKAYQSLVELVGASVAAELTGRDKSASRRPRRRREPSASTPSEHPDRIDRGTPGVAPLA